MSKESIFKSIVFPKVTDTDPETEVTADFGRDLDDDIDVIEDDDDSGVMDPEESEDADALSARMGRFLNQLAMTPTVTEPDVDQRQMFSPARDGQAMIVDRKANMAAPVPMNPYSIKETPVGVIQPVRVGNAYFMAPEASGIRDVEPFNPAAPAPGTIGAGGETLTKSAARRLIGKALKA